MLSRLTKVTLFVVIAALVVWFGMIPAFKLMFVAFNAGRMDMYLIGGFSFACGGGLIAGSTVLCEKEYTGF